MSAPHSPGGWVGGEELVIRKNDVRVKKRTDLEHGEGQQVGRDRDLTAELVDLGTSRLPVLDLSVHVRVLKHDAAEIFGDGGVCKVVLDGADHDFELEALGPGLKDRDGLRSLERERERTQQVSVKVRGLDQEDGEEW